MKIKVNTIPKEGMDCSEACDPKELDLDTSEIKFSRPLKADYHIIKEGSELLVTVMVSVSLETSCVCCLENLEYPIREEYTFNYTVKNTDTVDTTNDLRQEIILDYPLKPVCKPDCLGLCPKCGENLNKEECTCSRGTTQN